MCCKGSEADEFKFLWHLHSFLLPFLGGGKCVILNISRKAGRLHWEQIGSFLVHPVQVRMAR